MSQVDLIIQMRFYHDDKFTLVIGKVVHNYEMPFYHDDKFTLVTGKIVFCSFVPFYHDDYDKFMLVTGNNCILFIVR